MRVRYETRGPEDGPLQLVACGAEVDCPSAGAAAAAAAEIRRHLAPAPADRVEELVAAIELVSARRRESLDVAAVKLQLYVAQLASFPLDVLQAMAQRFIQRRGPDAWFPGLGEMLAVCDELVAPRRCMLAALEAWREPTEAERLRRQAMELRDLAHRAQQDIVKLYRGGNVRDVTDPERAAELQAVIADASREARRLELAARELETARA